MLPRKNQTNGKNFVISQYIPLLGDKSRNGKYICPNCGEPKLSINKDGKKYTCYGCEDSKAIAYLLRQSNGEFNGKRKTITYTHYQNNGTSHNNNNDNNNKQSKGEEIRELLCSLFPDLRFNENNREIYLENQLFKKEVCEPELLYTELNKIAGKDFSKEMVIDYLYSQAKEKTFNPTLEYLEKCRADFLASFNNQITIALEEADKLISQLSRTYLSTSIHLCDIYLKNWLLSAVGRIYSPACYARNVLILKGGQNIGKTTFFQILGGEWFSSSLGDSRSKDEIMIAHSHWILEWGELETIWGKKELGEIKSFITRTEDSIRYPYSRNVTIAPRSFMLCGTTNQDQFLTDKTGNTRFWVIPVKQKIALNEWEKNRDLILGAIATIIHYNLAINPNSIKKGRLWELTDELLEASTENSQEFTEVHPFEEVIDELIDTWNSEDSCDWIIANKIWHALEIPMKERPRWTGQLSAIMSQKGYKNIQKRVNGKKIRVWKKIK